jgi:hypothetical protein
MKMTRTPTPSPLAGEVAVPTRSVRAPGEGPGGAVNFTVLAPAGPHPATRCARGRPLPQGERERAPSMLRCFGGPARCAPV